MSKRFTPVVDPERARCEQDEESLRRHRKFDTPFALLPKNLNDPKQRTEDLNPLGKPTEDLVLDENKLWRKKTELFDKKKTWGRETFEYSNPEEARAEGSNANRKWRPGDVGWSVRGVRGGRGEDDGRLVLQRGEVDQTMVLNDKGLWVRRKASQGEAEAEEASRSPTPEGGWRCPKCNKGNSKQTHLCKACGVDRGMYEQYKARPGEDPRLEAAKPRGRGTADAQARALQALEERRKRERAAQEAAGLTRRPARGEGSAAYVPLNSSNQQVRAAKRLRKYTQWQGVQRTDEEAARVVAKALGGAREGEARPLRVEDLRAAGALRAGAGAGARADGSSPGSAPGSPSGSASGSASPRGGSPQREGGLASVDFF